MLADLLRSAGSAAAARESSHAASGIVGSNDTCSARGRLAPGPKAARRGLAHCQPSTCTIVVPQQLHCRGAAARTWLPAAIRCCCCLPTQSWPRQPRRPPPQLAAPARRWPFSARAPPAFGAKASVELSTPFPATPGIAGPDLARAVPAARRRQLGVRASHAGDRACHSSCA